MFLELKKSPYLWAYAAAVVVVIGALALRGTITNQQAVILLAAAIGSPGLFGVKKDPPEDPPAGQTPVLVDEIPVVVAPSAPPRGAQFVIGAVLAIGASGCAWMQKNEALFPTADQIACVYVQVEQGNQNALSVALACNIEETLLRDVEALIMGHQKGKARLAATQHDAGAP